jgi:hypothetical protein
MRLKLSNSERSKLQLLLERFLSGPKRNKQLAWILAKWLAKEQDPIGWRYLAFCLEKGIGVRRDSDAALRAWKRAALLGDVPSQSQFANFLARRGRGRDLRLAVDWDRRAAHAGFATSQFNLAQAHSKGLGVMRNAREAVRWWRTAANQRHAKAMCNLGVAYENGEGVRANRRRAAFWYSRAARAGDSLAARNLLRLRNKT